MGLREAKGDSGRDDGMSAGHPVDECSIPSVTREDASGGRPGAKRLAEDLVDQEAIACDERREGGRKRLGKGDRERAGDGGHADELVKLGARSCPSG